MSYEKFDRVLNDDIRCRRRIALRAASSRTLPGFIKNPALGSLDVQTCSANLA